MKKGMATLLLLVTLAAVTAGAQGGGWQRQLGALVNDPQGIRAVMADLGAEEAQSFASRLLRAANTLPLAADAKNQRLARIAHELVAGSRGIEGKQDALVAIFAQANPAYLSGIADVLSAGLEMSLNGIPQEEFLRVATNVITRVEQATVGDADALVRVTMTIATFLRAAGTTLDLEPILLACLSSADLASVVANVIGPAVAGKYDPMLQANGLDRSGAGNWFLGHVQATGEPLLPPWGNQAGWMGYDGGFGSGIGGTGLGGAGAIPPPAVPYRGQTITCRRCQGD